MGEGEVMNSTKATQTCWHCEPVNGVHSCQLCPECGDTYDKKDFVTCRYCAPKCPECGVWACHCQKNPIATKEHKNSAAYKTMEEK